MKKYNENKIELFEIFHLIAKTKWIDLLIAPVNSTMTWNSKYEMKNI